MLIVVSATNKRSAKDFDWYKFKGKRSVEIPKSNPEADISENDIFGVRKVGENYQLIFKEYPEILFRLSEKVALLVLKRSVGWTGTVGRIKVFAGSIGGAEPKPANTLMDNKPFVPPKEPKSAKTKFVALEENTQLTKQLKSLDIDGMKSLKFLQAQELIPGEVVYYYEIRNVYNQYLKNNGYRVAPKNWGDEIEALIESMEPDLDIECNTVRYLGEVKHIMSVAEE